MRYGTSDGRGSASVLALLLITIGFLLTACSGPAKLSHADDLSYESKGTSRSSFKAVDEILDDSLLSSAFIGIKIATADSGTILYERNGGKLFHPASNMKLLTTATAVRMLGIGYRFTTSLVTDGVVSDSTLKGNLIVRGSGDPLITTATLDSLVSQVAGKGIRTIDGDIVGDVSAFDTLSWGSGWMWDDEPSTDAAFITPLTVNENSLDVVASAGSKEGNNVLVRLEPPTDILKVLNEAFTSNDTLIPDLQIDRIRGENTLTVRGKLSPGGADQRVTLSVRHPEIYFLHLLQRSLLDHGFALKGMIRIDTLHGHDTLAQFASPIDSILHRINKPSDNLAAELLLKTVGKEVIGQPGSSERGLIAVRKYLSDAGADTTEMILADGSGLSWYNAVSPDVFVKLLLEQYRHPETFRTFYESLPVAGVDGTLRNRMKGTAAQDNVHAKTGSLTGVSSLSGYVKCADSTTLIFSILCNHYPWQIGTLRYAQDKIMKILANSRLTRHK